MFTVYIIRSIISGRYYTGYTGDIARRLEEHSHNNTSSLKNRGPFELVYAETYSTKKEATQRERQIKSYKGGDAFKKLVKV